jgi:hypothetical protein
MGLAAVSVIVVWVILRSPYVTDPDSGQTRGTAVGPSGPRGSILRRSLPSGL